MNKSTIQVIRKVQVAEQTKNAADIYFSHKGIPENSLCRPPTFQRTQANKYLDQQKKNDIPFQIQKATNIDTIAPKKKDNSLINDLKIVAKKAEKVQNTTQFCQHVKNFKHNHPGVIIPAVSSVCLRDENTMLSYLESVPIKIDEIAPYFALSDEITHLDEETDLPLISMVSPCTKYVFTQAPSFTSEYNKDVAPQLLPEIKQKYNFMQKVSNFPFYQLPKLEQTEDPSAY